MFQKGKPNPYHKKSVAARKANGGYSKPWNKGLTKESDERVKHHAEYMIGNKNGLKNKDKNN